MRKRHASTGRLPRRDALIVPLGAPNEPSVATYEAALPRLPEAPISGGDDRGRKRRGTAEPSRFTSTGKIHPASTKHRAFMVARVEATPPTDDVLAGTPYRALDTIGRRSA